jgi:hypothetical protein
MKLIDADKFVADLKEFKTTMNYEKLDMWDIECVLARQETVGGDIEDAGEVGNVMEALKKSIGRKVVRVVSGADGGSGKTVDFLCPTCNKSVIGAGNYCWNCGQKLGWYYGIE